MKSNDNGQLTLFGNWGIPAQSELAQTVRLKVSKTGAKSVSLIPGSSKDPEVSTMKSVSGYKGVQLKGFVRTQQDALKSEMGRLHSNVHGSANWTGKRATLSSDGNTISFSYKRVEPLVVKKFTRDDALALLSDEERAAIEKLAKKQPMRVEAPAKQPEPETKPEPETAPTPQMV